MKKRALIVLVALVGSFFVNGVLVGQEAEAVDNFVIENFEVDMELGRDSDGRSTLRTVETITANFQVRNQNRGLERAFVKSYDGHGTSLKVVSVTDGNDKELPHHWSGSTLRIGDKDTYVYGPQTYKITFTQRDVTKHYEDTGKNEFYWDAIGTEWRVPIHKATVRLNVAPDIENTVQTDVRCYRGAFGSTDQCAATLSDGVYTVETESLSRSSGVTVALGFAPDTFAPYQKSLLEQLFGVWIIVTVVTSIIAAGTLVWLTARARRWTYRDDELGTIVPEYIPPKNASVAVSAAVSPGVYATMAAQLTDLAVRHYIQILETKAKKSFWQSAEYDIKVVRDIKTLRAEEQEILKDMFGHRPKVGEQLALKTLQNNTTAYTRFSDNDKKLKALLRGKYELKLIDHTRRGWFGTVSKVLFGVGVITLSPLLLLAGLIALILSKTLWVLSDEGLALRRYVKGLEMYIKVAEKERLKMLQSPEGAEKVHVSDPTNPVQLVKLYERVLPYAVLFGQEKEWTKRLGEYYTSTNSSPSWYSGQTAFNAVVFSSAMSSFSSAVATTSASSSSSGGSGGGGYSGGGGGGGGGGGW